MNPPKPIPWYLFFRTSIILLVYFSGIIAGATIIILFTNGYIDEIYYKITHKPNPVQHIEDYCSSFSSLQQKLYCIKNNINFKYKIKIDIPAPTPQLLKNGGDCYDWSHFWKRVGEYYGYSAKTIPINLFNNSGHMFTIINSKNEYCLVDIDIIHCIKLETEKIKKKSK